MIVVMKHSSKRLIEEYARTLYENYRAHMQKQNYHLPAWNEVSVHVKREFKQEAKQLLN